MASENRPARIGFLLSQLGTHAADVFADEIQHLGITASEAGVIRIIAHTPGITQRALASKLGTGQSRVVALIDGLEHKDLVTRTRGATDRRQQHLDLTAVGRRLLPKLRQAAEAQETELTQGLTDQQRADLYELLSLLSSSRDLDSDVHPGYRGTAR